MAEIIRARKDVNDLRPIPVNGAKSYSYRWKMMALMEINEDDQHVLPFSRRVVHGTKSLWPRSRKLPPPIGYELCGCIGCENKTWADHVLKDDADDEVSAYGNLHLEVIQLNAEMTSETGGGELSSSSSSSSPPPPPPPLSSSPLPVLSAAVVAVALASLVEVEEEEEVEAEEVDEEEDDNDDEDEETEEEEDDVDDHQMDTSDDTYVPSSCSTSPFPCGDPYDSYDWES